MGCGQSLRKNTVAVTAGSGFIASQIIKQLLEEGYYVNTTTRDVKNPNKVNHLIQLQGAKERLKLFEADLMEPGSFKECFAGCTAVFHTATPVPDWNQIFQKDLDGEKLFQPSSKAQKMQ